MKITCDSIFETTFSNRNIHIIKNIPDEQLKKYKLAFKNCKEKNKVGFKGDLSLDINTNDLIFTNFDYTSMFRLGYQYALINENIIKH